MTLEQLKEKVHALIRNGQTEAALEAVGAWADAHQQAQVKKEVTLLMASWWDLNRDKRRGLIDNAEAAMRTNQTHDRILESLESIKGESGEDAPAPVSGLPEDVVYEFLAYLLENKDKNRWVETQNGFAKPRGWSEFKMNDLVSEFEKRGWVGDVVKVARNWPQLRITIKGEFEFERLKANMEKKR